VCIERAKGSFSITTLMLDDGARQSLGVFAGGHTLLKSLPDRAVYEIVSVNALKPGAYSGCTVPVLMRLLKRCRELGCAPMTLISRLVQPQLGCQSVRFWARRFLR